MAKPLYRKNSTAPRPGNAVEGAAIIHAEAAKLYDRQDGTGADWRMVTDALFRAAFDALDKLPDDACRSVARRVHEGAYDRVTEGPKGVPAASNGGLSGAENSPSNTSVLESKGPTGENDPSSAS